MPWFDDRRTPAQAALNATGADHVNPDTLLAVLSTKPVLNQMTTYSIVAQPKTADVFTHFVRYCAPLSPASAVSPSHLAPPVRQRPLPRVSVHWPPASFSSPEFVLCLFTL